MTHTAEWSAPRRLEPTILKLGTRKGSQGTWPRCYGYGYGWGRYHCGQVLRTADWACCDAIKNSFDLKTGRDKKAMCKLRQELSSAALWGMAAWHEWVPCWTLYYRKWMCRLASWSSCSVQASATFESRYLNRDGARDTNWHAISSSTL